MPFLIVGVLLLACKMAGWGPPSEWAWWIVLTPFVLAVLWWQFADATGLTKKRAMQKMEDRKVARREQALDALGIDPRKGRQGGKAGGTAGRRAAADDNAAAAAKRRDRPS